MKTVYRYFPIITLLLLISNMATAINMQAKPHFKKKHKINVNFTYKEDSCKIYFTDRSRRIPNLPIKEWLWNFGDGQTSTVKNPTHVYASSGNYNVCLEVTVKTLKGLIKERDCKNVRVTCGTKKDTICNLKPSFAFKSDSCNVSFKDNSTAAAGATITNWYWNFGDGQMDSTQNPTHFYGASGVYNVCLIIVAKNGTSTCKERICMKVEVKCGSNNGSKCKLKPDFAFKSDSCKVVFNNNSTAGAGTTITNWYWSFGDGQTDTTQNPTHTYIASGVYNVCLVIAGKNGNDNCKERICKKVEVRCGGNNGSKCKLNPNFVFKSDSCNVVFNNNSTAGVGTTITKWLWNFGDGQTDTTQNPTHTYAVSGMYNVCLLITGYNGKDDCRERTCKQVLVKCGPVGKKCELKPGFSFKTDSCKVIFNQFSTAGPGTTIIKWHWNFGDGQTDTTQNPTHAYVASGVYDVCLVIVGKNGKDNCEERICKKVEVRCGIIGKKCELKPNFAFKVDSCSVTFKNLSVAGLGTTITNWYWNFGDGQTDMTQNPTHKYAKTGEYRVCLTISGNNGNSKCKEDFCLKVKVERCRRGYLISSTGELISADNEEVAPEVMIYPNPAQSSANIDFNLLSQSNVNVSVTDIYGKTITTLVNKYLSTGTYKLNWLIDSNVPSGMYIIQIKTDNSIQRKELILIK
jgi:PKD repeat protein